VLTATPQIPLWIIWTSSSRATPLRSQLLMRIARLRRGNETWGQNFRRGLRAGWPAIGATTRSKKLAFLGRQRWRTPRKTLRLESSARVTTRIESDVPEKESAYHRPGVGRVCRRLLLAHGSHRIDCHGAPRGHLTGKKSRGHPQMLSSGIRSISNAKGSIPAFSGNWSVVNVNVELRCGMCIRRRKSVSPYLFPRAGLANAPMSIPSSTGTSVSRPFESALNLRASTLMVKSSIPVIPCFAPAPSRHSDDLTSKRRRTAC
jgi:hypothetical protein